MPNYIFDKPESQYDLPSLADSKSFDLSSKLRDKKQKLAPGSTTLGPTPAELAEADRVLSSGGSNDGLLNQAESSTYQGIGKVADTYENIQQNMFGNKDYSLSEGIDNLSDEAYSDQKAGFTGRGEYSKDIQTLSDTVANFDASNPGDYWDVGKQSLALGPRALADSAASGIELAIGSAAVAAATAIPLPGTGPIMAGAIFGNKAKKVADAGEKVVSLIDRIKNGAKAVSTLAVKTAGRTSLLTADITEQMRQEYKAANEGREPTAAWYATNVPITMALNAVELGLISKAIPKFSKPTIKGMKESVKFMDRKNAVEAAKRILNGVGKVTATAGAEAGQEYFQTWHEILAPVVKGDTLNEIVKNAAPHIGLDKNKTEAIVGSLLGFTAGGTARIAPVAPGVAAGVAADLTKATVKGTANTVIGTAKIIGEGADHLKNVAQFKVMSPSQRKEVENTYNVNRKAADESIGELDRKISVVEKAKTYSDIVSDEEVAKLAKEIQMNVPFTDPDLDIEENLNKMKSKLVAGYKGLKLKINTEVEGTRIAALAKESAKHLKNKAIEVAVAAIDKVPEKAVVNTILAVIKTQDTAKSAIEAVKNLESSTARGIIEIGLKGTTEQSAIALKAAQDLTIDDLAIVTNIITESEKNQQLAKDLGILYEKQKRMLKDLGLRSDDLVTEDNLPQAIKDIADTGKYDGRSPGALGKIIFDTTAQKIGDKATLAKIEKALNIYEASGKGTIDKTNMAAVRKKLKKQARDLEFTPTMENVVGAAGKVKNKVVAKAKSAWEATLNAVDKARIKNAQRQDKNNDTGTEEYDKVKAEIDAKEKLAKEKETTVPKESPTQKGIRWAKELTAEVKKEFNKFADEAKNRTVTETEDGVTISIAKNQLVKDKTVIDLNAGEIKEYRALKNADISSTEKKTKLDALYRKAIARALKKEIINAAKATTKFVKEEAKVAVDTVKKANEKTIDNDVLKIVTQLDAVIPNSNAAAVDSAIGVIPTIITSLHNNGINSEADFKAFIEKYPGFKKNQEFFEVFEDLFFEMKYEVVQEGTTDPQIKVEEKVIKDTEIKEETKDNTTGCK